MPIPERAYVTRSPETDSVFRTGETISLYEIVRYFWARRWRIAGLTALLFAVFVVVLVWSRIVYVEPVRGVLQFAFPGATQHEFPTGRPFRVERIVDPDVLGAALRHANVDPQRLPPLTLRDGIDLVPEIPAAVQARWQQQDQAGQPREQVYPTRYAMTMVVEGLSAGEKRLLFTAILRSYLEAVQRQETAILPDFAKQIPRVQQTSEYADAIGFVDQQLENLRSQLRTIANSGFLDPVTRGNFRSLEQRLNALESAEMTDLRALVNLGRLARDRELMIRRLQFGISELNREIATRRGQVDELTPLLAKVERPMLLRPDEVPNAPRVDEHAWDYYGKLVTRIADLSAGAVTEEVNRRNLERQLQALIDAPASVEMIGLYERRFKLAIEELAIVGSAFQAAHRHLLDEMVLGEIRIVEGPVLVSGLPIRTTIAVPLALLASLLLAIVFVAVNDFLHSALSTPGPAAVA